MHRLQDILAKVAAVVMIAMAAACGKEDEPTESIPVLVIKTNPAACEKSDQFISVTADKTSEWTLEADASWISFSPSSGTGSVSTVVMSIGANTGEAARNAVVSLTTRNHKVTMAFTQNSKEVKPTPGTPATPGIASDSMPAWLELPATYDGDGRDFFSHNVKIGTSTVRNYSFDYDYSNLLALWVAYPLNAWYIGSGSRSDKWGLDPLLPADKQANLSSGYKEGNCGWRARGHQIASADRLDYASNVQTFYYTNMTPQINDKFNSDIWAKLEGQVRDWAKSSDTLYVVTGCVVDGSKEYALDNSGKKCTVPTGYYKAVLRRSKSSTVGISGAGERFMGCAIFLEHKTYSIASPTKDMFTSIDALENKLGIDLFANLPSLVGKDAADQIEAQDPKTVGWWW